MGTDASYEELLRKTTEYNKKLEFWEEEITRLILWAQKEWFCDWDSASSAWVSIERDWDAGGQSWIGVNTRVRAAKPDNWSTLLLHGNRGEATYRLLENEQQHRDSDMEMHKPAYPRAPLHHCHLWCTILKSAQSFLLVSFSYLGENLQAFKLNFQNYFQLK